MAIYKRDIVDINLETGNIHRSFLKHSIGYLDQQADRFGIRTYRDGAPVDLSGVSVQGIFMPPQGSPISITGVQYTSVIGNEAIVVLPQACYNYDGQFTLAIKLVDSTNAITGTMRIIDGMVDNTHASGTVAPTSAVPTYQEILATYDAMVAATAATNASLANYYSDLPSRIPAGTYCIYNHVLYRCIATIASKGDWDSSYWTPVKLGNDVDDLRSDVNDSFAGYYSDLPSSIPVGTYCIYNNILYRCISPIASKGAWDASKWVEAKLANDTSDLKSALNYGRTPSEITLTPLAKYIQTSAFDLKTNMPYCTWWAGAFSLVKTSLTTGLFSNFPLSLSDSDTIRIEKYANVGGSSGYYRFVSGANRCECLVNYGGTVCTWYRAEDIINSAIHSNSIIVNSTNVSTYNDANNFPSNVVVFVNVITDQISHAPYTDCRYSIISTGYLTHEAPYGGEFQLAVPHSSTSAGIKYRSYNGESWTSWTVCDSNLACIRSSDIIVISGNVSTYNNVDNYPINSILLVNVDGTSITNYPFGSDRGSIITTGYLNRTSLYGGAFQIAVPFNNTKHSILTRSYNGSNWTNWVGDSSFTADSTNFIEIIDIAKKTNGAKVYLSAGTYYLFDETHDETYWKAKRSATRYCGIELSNGIKIIGNGEVTLNAVYSGSDDDIKENFSVFNISGDFSLENINVVAQNICYIVHDDQGIVTFNPSIGVYENCKFVNNGSDHTFVSGSPVCIGGGCSGTYVKRTIKNCIFSAPTRNNPVNYHTSSGKYGEIIFTGNYFIDGTIRFNKYVGGSLVAKVTNNSLKADIIGRDADGVTVYDWNNIIRT